MLQYGGPRGTNSLPSSEMQRHFSMHGAPATFESNAEVQCLAHVGHGAPQTTTVSPRTNHPQSKNLRVRTSGRFPRNPGIPTLKLKNLTESKPLKFKMHSLWIGRKNATATLA